MNLSILRAWFGKIALCLLFIVCMLFHAKAQTRFHTYFNEKTLRFDYIHAGTRDTSVVFFKQLKEEPYWGGSLTNLIDTFRYGKYFMQVLDSATNKIIYSRGYCSLFEEWQTTKEARQIQRSFYETVVMPYPKHTIRLEILERDRKNQFHTKFEMYINPANYFIVTEQPPDFNVKKLADAGIPSQNLDIAIIGEGYTSKQQEKFIADATRFTNQLFNTQPFVRYKNAINIWAIEAISVDSGTDIPAQNVWKNTIVHSKFYTFDSERYLSVQDINTLRNIAACVPYDQICVLVNTDKYGGGGIFNHYSICTSDHLYSDFVFVHELGHALGALADEYYTSEVSYENYFDLTVEPYQPNITTLIDFNSKWKTMLLNEIPIPTPVNDTYKNQTGVFEGGGYMAKGIYRPAFNCYMKSASAKGFCKVCQKALADMIMFYSE